MYLREVKNVYTNNIKRYDVSYIPQQLQWFYSVVIFSFKVSSSYRYTVNMSSAYLTASVYEFAVWNSQLHDRSVFCSEIFGHNVLWMQPKSFSKHGLIIVHSPTTSREIECFPLTTVIHGRSIYYLILNSLINYASIALLYIYIINL